MVLRLQQPVEVDDHIFHLGVVDGPLRRAAPGLFGVGIIVEQTDQVDRIQVDEVETAGILDPPAENQVKLAHARPATKKRGGPPPLLRVTGPAVSSCCGRSQARPGRTTWRLARCRRSPTGSPTFRLRT